jgi:hypothetical protein
MGKWVCPCLGCQKAKKQTFEDILDMLYENNDLSHNAWRVKEKYLELYGKKK